VRKALAIRVLALLAPVIVAFGGDHLELGEHMLAQEYFPNENLAMRADLKDALVHYYDFLVAYQNLLRGGGAFDSPAVTSTNGSASISAGSQLSRFPIKC